MRQDPDLLFFSGDQTYHHTEHTVGWIEFGLQYRDLIKDRPTICVPDDHDVRHPNLWGEEGGHSTVSGADGGYFFPAAYVNMVQRAQCWHLPDPVDPAGVVPGFAVLPLDELGRLQRVASARILVRDGSPSPPPPNSRRHQGRSVPWGRSRARPWQA